MTIILGLKGFMVLNTGQRPLESCIIIYYKYHGTGVSQLCLMTGPFFYQHLDYPLMDYSLVKTRLCFNPLSPNIHMQIQKLISIHFLEELLERIW